MNKPYPCISEKQWIKSVIDPAWVYSLHDDLRKQKSLK